MSPFVVKAIQLLMSLSFLIILMSLGTLSCKNIQNKSREIFPFFDVKFALIKKKIGERHMVLVGFR